MERVEGKPPLARGGGGTYFLAPGSDGARGSPHSGADVKIIVTGGAGFIGAHLCRRLLSRGDRVVAVDNFDPFYPPALKRRSADELQAFDGFRLVEADLLDPAALTAGLGSAGVQV